MGTKRLISLGRNCEVSFQIEKHVEKLEASLFSWAFVNDEKLFIQALYHLDDILDGPISLVKTSEDMFLFETYKLAFHGRTNKNRFLNETGEVIDEKLYNESIGELKERIQYLISKFKKQLSDEEETIFLKTIDVNGDFEKAKYIIEETRKYLEQCRPEGKYKLVIVIEEKYDNGILSHMEDNYVSIRTVSHFAPIDDTKEGADNAGWRKLIFEFCFGKVIEPDLAEQLEHDMKKYKNLYQEWEMIQKKYNNIAEENRKLNELLVEKDKWIAALQEGKDWLEKQYLSLVKQH